MASFLCSSFFLASRAAEFIPPFTPFGFWTRGGETDCVFPAAAAIDGRECRAGPGNDEEEEDEEDEEGGG